MGFLVKLGVVLHVLMYTTKIMLEHEVWCALTRTTLRILKLCTLPCNNPWANTPGFAFHVCQVLEAEVIAIYYFKTGRSPCPPGHSESLPLLPLMVNIKLVVAAGDERNNNTFGNDTSNCLHPPDAVLSHLLAAINCNIQ